jgi:LysM repeat protein
MTKRSPSSDRALAAVALVAGFLVLFVVIATSLSGGDSSGTKKTTPAGEVTKQGPSGESEASAYVVQNGDTLTSISHKTGVSVRRLQELNPGVDPQILISGEKLKLK